MNFLRRLFGNPHAEPEDLPYGDHPALPHQFRIQEVFAFSRHRLDVFYGDELICSVSPSWASRADTDHGRDWQARNRDIATRRAAIILRLLEERFVELSGE